MADLLDILSNTLVLQQIAPYLSLPAILSLSNASKSLQFALGSSRELYRYLDLSQVKTARLPFQPIDNGGNVWRSQRMDEALTEDEFYSGPLRGIFSHLHKRHVLKNVQILILDGLSVPADLVQDILTEDRYNIRVLSIRETTHTNERKLMQALKYAVRPSRPAGTPRLKALYVFGRVDRGQAVTSEIRTAAESVRAGGITASQGAQIGAIGAAWNERSEQALAASISRTDDEWYQPTGRMTKTTPGSEWAETLKACEGIIAFDAVLCRGPRHNVQLIRDEMLRDTWLTPAIANIALGPSGCAKCNSSPEGPALYKQSPSHHLPLLGPPSTRSSSVLNSQMPVLTSGTTYPPLFVRCQDCLRGRWCERCNKWWDESCYQILETGRQAEVRQDVTESSSSSIKVHLGFCIEYCLIGEMMSGAGSFGMWG